MTTDILSPISFARGPAWPNRMALAPLTNKQSHDDGTLSDAEQHWLVKRADGGFGLVMTCAAHVQAVGQGFPGQMGIFADRHIERLKGLADAIRARGSISSVQLHHAGNRSDKSVVPHPVGASDDPESGARGLTTAEVEQLRDDFIAGARRAEAAGFDGVEVHGAHGYILAQFLSAEVNHREDRYGGSFENRSRIVVEILDGIRAACGPDFQLGLRVSPERFGMRLPEIVGFVADLMAGDKVDYIDLSLWDFRKMPVDADQQDKSLLGHFIDLPRHKARLGGAGISGLGTLVCDIEPQRLHPIIWCNAAARNHQNTGRLVIEQK